VLLLFVFGLFGLPEDCSAANIFSISVSKSQSDLLVAAFVFDDAFDEVADSTASSRTAEMLRVAMSETLGVKVGTGIGAAGTDAAGTDAAGTDAADTVGVHTDAVDTDALDTDAAETEEADTEATVTDVAVEAFTVVAGDIRLADVVAMLVLADICVLCKLLLYNCGCKVFSGCLLSVTVASTNMSSVLVSSGTVLNIKSCTA
jgi:hypothetical protein